MYKTVKFPMIIMYFLINMFGLFSNINQTYICKVSADPKLSSKTYKFWKWLEDELNTDKLKICKDSKSKDQYLQ